MIAKLYEHPTIDNAYLIETQKGVFVITNDYVKITERDCSELNAITWDIYVQAMLANAYEKMKDLLSADEILILSLLVDEKISDYDRSRVRTKYYCK